MTQKIVPMTIEKLPEGFKVTGIFGIVSKGRNNKTWDDACSVHPEANAVIGVQYIHGNGSFDSMRYIGTAVRIEGPGF